jgi:hypothetical protein
MGGHYPCSYTHVLDRGIVKVHRKDSNFGGTFRASPKMFPVQRRIFRRGQFLLVHGVARLAVGSFFQQGFGTLTTNRNSRRAPHQST